ncbi:hypothetical protein Tco_1495654, partial [Tanacetum coccineum]
MDATTTTTAEFSSPLLNDFVDGAVDYKTVLPSDQNPVAGDPLISSL